MSCCGCCNDEERNSLVNQQPRSVSYSSTDVNRLKEEITYLRQVIDRLTNRLSEIASAKLTDNNPDIVDLSDINRPDKLGERYSELYDNEWTDAFDAFTKELNMSKEEAVEKLLHILMTSYNVCMDASKKQMESLDCFGGAKDLPVQTMRVLKDCRKEKKVYRIQVEELITPKVKEALSLPDEVNKRTGKFLSSCVELCWLASVQDPPLYIDDPASIKDNAFNKNRYREYTVRGDTVKYVLWPTMYICKGGNVLKKGTAQCCQREDNIASLNDTDRGDEKGNNEESMRDTDQSCQGLINVESVKDTDQDGQGENNVEYL